MGVVYTCVKYECAHMYMCVGMCVCTQMWVSCTCVQVCKQEYVHRCGCHVHVCSVCACVHMCRYVCAYIDVGVVYMCAVKYECVHRCVMYMCAGMCVHVCRV